MPTERTSITASLLSKGFIGALVLLAPVIASCFPITSGQRAGGAASLPSSAPAVPTTIKNAPFSAQIETQYDHVLANGNHIRRETRGRIFRDAQGRVRTETEVPALSGVESLEHIAIQDPILHEIIHLDPRTRTASIHHISGPSTAIAEAPHAAIPTKSGKALLSAPESSAGNAALPAQRSETANATTESLGIRVIEGLSAIGTRTTHTIANGPGEPIVAVHEVWYSRDLQMVILSISDDGQSGHSEMRVTHIVRGAPNEKLFQVPPDYTVKDGSPLAAVVKH